MLKELLLAGALGAAFAAATAPSSRHASATSAQDLAAPKPTPTPQEPAPQAQAPEPAARPSGDGAAKPKAAAGSNPRVTEIREAELRSLLGGGAGRTRPLLVNFWATWCAPCRDEFPDLVRIRKKYSADKLDFIIISLDDPSDIAGAVPDFLREVRATAFPAYLLHVEDDASAINLVDPTWGGELPATFLYDRSGAMAFKHKGRINPAELRAAVEKVLREKPQQASAQKK